MVAMAIESAMIPLPSELILPYAGFLVSDPTPDRAAHRPARGTSGSWSIVATIGNTLGSLIAYAIGAWGGRPFLERYGKYLLIRPHEIELAEQFFAALRRRDRVLQPAPADRPDVHLASRPASPGCRSATFIVYSTAGAFLWSTPARLRGHRPRRELGGRSATRSSRSTC